MREDDAARRSPGLYRKIEVRMWGDDKFCRLSSLAPSGQALWLYLLTGPHTGPIPGLFKAGRAGMAEELDWEPEAFDKAFQEVFGQGMAKADFRARLVWLPNAVKINPPASPNVVRSWRAAFDLLPECPLKSEALVSLRASISSLGEPFAKAFDESFGKASAKTCPNQEQEQDKEKEEKEDAAPPPVGGVGRPPKPKPKSSASPRSSLIGGSKPPGGRRPAEPPPTAAEIAAAEAVLADGEASDEDRFFALKHRLAAKKVRWSFAMMILRDSDGDHGVAVRALEKSLGTRDPTSYLGAVAKGQRIEAEALNPTRPNSKSNGVPGWVVDCRAEGELVQPDGPDRWLWRGCTYDDRQNETGF